MKRKSKKIKDTDYLFLSAYLRAQENSLLTEARMDRMLDAPTVEDAARILTECGYGELNAVNVDTVARMLDEERDRVFADLNSFARDPRMLDIFKIKYDYHNAKTLLKSEAMGEKPDRLLVDAGRLPGKVLARAVAESDYDAVPQTLAEAIPEARELLSRTKDPQQVDFLLDQAYFHEMAALAEDCRSDFLKGYVELLVDAANLRSAVRVLRMGKDRDFLKTVLFEGGTIELSLLSAVADGKSSLTDLYAHTPLEEAAELGKAVSHGGALTAFEKACDNALLDNISEAKQIPFGEQPLIAYLAARDSEQTAIRIILTGRLAGLPTDVIRERLRDAYV